MGVVLLRGMLPAVFAIAMGVLVGAVQRGELVDGSLDVVGVVFVLLQVLDADPPAVSANLGDRTAAWLYDRLTEACVAPAGHGASRGSGADQRPHRRARFRSRHDRAAAVDLDGLHRRRAGRDDRRPGLRRRPGRFAWWAPLVLAGAWLATHWLLRESAVWRDRNTDEVRAAQRDADYAYRLAVDPPASKELRLFGLAGWTIDRFIARRTRLHELQYEATRLRERPVLWSLLLVVARQRRWCSGRWRGAAPSGRINLGELVDLTRRAPSARR